MPDVELNTEYSVSEFKRAYYKIFGEQVLPILVKYEDERKFRLKGAIVAMVIFAVLIVFCFFNVHGKAGGQLVGILCAVAVLFWNWIQKSFERKLKTEIMPYLMKAFQSFYWQDTPPVTHEEISKIKIFSRIDSARKSFDDCFVGKYRGVQVAISECHYETGGKNSVTIFNGAVIKLKMNKNFSGITVIRPTSVGWGNFLDLKKYKMNKVELEDVKFNEKYTVYSTDQVESRYLLTPTFMERFENISLAFSSSGCFCSFYGDSVYIAPYVSGDLFKLFSLWKPVTESKQFQVLFEEIVSILELVDHFKLDTRLGL